MTDWPDVPYPVEPADSQAGADQTASLVPDPLSELKLKPQIVEALSTVYDPEIPVNIYELGLIYDIVVDAQGVVGIRMTLTAPACPAAQFLPAQVAERIRAIPGVADVRVDVVWDPPWSMEKMSEAARLQLGLL